MTDNNYYNKVVEIIRKKQFEFHRQGKGSHEIWASPVTGIKVSIPRNLRSRHTANRILKDAGCDERV